MSPDVQAIDEAMKAQGKKPADLARLLGLDSSQVSRIFNGKRRVQVHEMRRIDEWLGRSGAVNTSTTGIVVPMPNMIPVYGWVGASSAQRLTLAEQNVRGYVPMHPNQANLRDPFALQVQDVSMVPRYEPGENVYIAPHRWPSRNQDCVVVLKDGQGMLKRFLRRDEQAVYLHQLNPDMDLPPVPLEDIEAVHAVVGRD